MTTLTRSAYAFPGTSTGFKTGSWRVQRPVHRHASAPCHTACPAGEDAQAWLARLEEGNARAAWEEIVSVNPMPAITGRVCHHPCESACNRGGVDEAIAIHNVERHLGDQAIKEGWDYPVAAPSPIAQPVAVVGAGPAGLSCAYHLVRLGYQVTLFDELPAAGGTLRTALPSYRLPRDILDAEVERILGIGIEFKAHHRLGREMSLEELESQYRAVFLGPGTQRAREWSIDGATPRDLHVGLNLLQEWIAVGEVVNPKSAAIVGGGNTAVDLSRILRRAGVEEVHVITHQGMPGGDTPDADLMHAIPREIEQAIEEGVQFHDHRGIRRLILRGEQVVGVEMVHMKKMDRGNGKSERVAFEGTETVLHVDQVIPAIGQEVEHFGMQRLLHNATRFTVDAMGNLDGHPGLFAGGDARRGTSGTVTGAVGDGRRAASAIDQHVRGTTPTLEKRGEPITLDALNLNYYSGGKRPVEPTLPVAERGECEEIEQGISHTESVNESKRCLSCGSCFACDNCWTLCPDSAVLKTQEAAADGSHYVFDYDFCKGCGLCAKECPCGFIAMEDEL